MGFRDLVERQSKKIRLDQAAQVNPFQRLVECQLRGNCAAVCLQLDQALGFELAQGFADRNDADAERFCDSFLPQGVAAAYLPFQNSFPNLRCYRLRYCKRSFGLIHR